MDVAEATGVEKVAKEKEKELTKVKANKTLCEKGQSYNNNNNDLNGTYLAGRTLRQRLQTLVSNGSEAAKAQTYAA